MKRLEGSVHLFAAAAALTLVLSSIALASEFSAEELPATISGSSTEATFSAEGGSVFCAAALSAGLSEFSPSLTVTPSYSKCKAFGFLEATVNTEGCKDVLHGGGEIAEETYAVTADISCESGKSIKVTGGTCALEIGPQNGLSGGKIKDETVNAPEEATLEGKIAKVAYTVTKDGFLCPLTGTGKKENGEFGGLATLTAGGEVLAEDGFVLAEAHGTPNPMKFTAENQTTSGAIVFTDAGTYEIYEQYLVNTTEGFTLSTSSKTNCPGEIVVPAKGKTCVYTIRDGKAAVGAEDVIETKWAPKGAKYARVIRSTIRRVS